MISLVLSKQYVATVAAKWMRADKVQMFRYRYIDVQMYWYLCMKKQLILGFSASDQFDFRGSGRPQYTLACSVLGISSIWKYTRSLPKDSEKICHILAGCWFSILWSGSVLPYRAGCLVWCTNWGALLSCPCIALIVRTTRQTISKTASGVCKWFVFHIGWTHLPEGLVRIPRWDGILGCSYHRWLWSRGYATAKMVAFCTPCSDSGGMLGCSRCNEGGCVTAKVVVFYSPCTYWECVCLEVQFSRRGERFWKWHPTWLL